MKITLANIAAKTGVTTSTVQRALNGGGGVSNEKRALIQKVATELGYKRNFYASYLRRGFIRIAVIFPDTSYKNKFFSHYLWVGIHRYLEESNIPFIEPIFLFYENSPIELTMRLQEVLDKKHGKIDGIVTRGSIDTKFTEQMYQFEQEGVPVVLAGTDSKTRNRLSCVRSYEEMTGCLAADLLLSFGALEKCSKVVVCGNFSGLNQFNNAQGFERQLWENNMHSDLIKISTDLDFEKTYANILEFLKKNPDIGAIYACSTRSTLSACEAVKHAGLIGKVRIIGSDLFEESVQLLREGRLNAIIHNRPVTIAYRSIQVLVDYLLNTEDRPSETVLISSAIVMKGNLDFYLSDSPISKKNKHSEENLYHDDGMQF